MLVAFGWIITAIGLVIKFVKSILVKYVGFAVVLSFQFAITASTIVFVLAFYAFIVTSLVTAYNYGHSIPDYILANSGGLSCFMGVLDMIGFSAAFSNGYTMFFVTLSTIMIFHLMKFTFFATRMIANEVFKLGVLLGQAMS